MGLCSEVILAGELNSFKTGVSSILFSENISVSSYTP